ncbi:hypothetical protein KSS87_016449 [Heliosperma pusillum]|nr:hypothetical protein KSS87_016449 [Heliosperma pusillum]
MSFLTVAKELEFYKIYAFACGFDVRKHTKGTAKGGVCLKLIVCNKQGERPIVYDENGKVIEDFDEVDVRKIEMSNVWSEIYKTVGLLDSGELKNMKEFSKLLKHFRETVVGALEKKSKNKEIEDLLGCKAPQEIDILPPHKAKNKESGKRQMSSKEKADLPADDDERETDDEELEEKQYTEADMDGQFIAGVKALKKSYTRVNTSIPDNWSAVLEAMELMHAYKKSLRDDFLG